jgi:hypothetical protein
MAREPRKTTAGATFVGLLLVGSVQQLTWATPSKEQNSDRTASERTAIVRVDNVSGIRSDVLRLAEGRAQEVFQKIGAAVTWVDITPAREQMVPMFTLVFVGVAPSADPYWREHEVFGFAAPSAKRAWVFWDRIEAERALAPALGIVLGDVMAHELGHLMLSSSGHSSDGIMRAQVERQTRTTETFTKRQAVDILNRLQQLRAANHLTN